MPKGSVKNGNKTSAKVIDCKIKAAKALELRMEGNTFQTIAKEAGYKSSQAAFDAVKRAIAAITREPATELLNLELERLDVLWQIQYLNAQGGDVQAMASCMKIMERRARYLGLDAPTSTQLGGIPGGEPIVLSKIMDGIPLAKLSADELKQLESASLLVERLREDRG